MAQLPLYNPKWDIMYLQEEINKLELRIMALEEELNNGKEKEQEQNSKA